jgi:molybdopterin-containing oxidoreductase family membrane subunit
MARALFDFIKNSIATLLKGGLTYYLWMGWLVVCILAGMVAIAIQIRDGLLVTAMSDQVSWGAYIANFTFVVGLTDAAVMVSIPAFIYGRRSMRSVIWIALYLAIAATLMAGLFVMVDVGRPDRGWHLAPIIGILNFPDSMLSWDVLVLNAYIVVTGMLIVYVLFTWSRKRGVSWKVTIPWILATSFLAIFLHTITAFLYSWLGARPFWNAAIVAPRFLASAFFVGPAFLIISLQIIRRYMRFEFQGEVIDILRRIITIAMLFNLFLFAAEFFKEFKSESLHVASAVYLFFGLEGHHVLVPYIWTALVLNLATMTILVIPALEKRRWLLNTACLMGFVGIWIEKGMGLIVPGFVPGPLGDVVDYTPSLVEFFVCAGVWAIGMLIFTVLIKVGVPLQLNIPGDAGIAVATKEAA